MTVISECVSWTSVYHHPKSITPATLTAGNSSYVMEYEAMISTLEYQMQDTANFFDEQQTTINKTAKVSYGVFLEPIYINNNKGNKLRILCIMPLFEGEDLNNLAKQCFRSGVSPLGDYKKSDIVRIVKDDKNNIQTIFINPQGKNTGASLGLEATALALCTYPRKVTRVNKTYNKFTNFALIQLDPVLKNYSDQDLASDHKIMSALIEIPKIPPKEKLKKFGKGFVTSFTGSKKKEKKT